MKVYPASIRPHTISDTIQYKRAECSSCVYLLVYGGDDGPYLAGLGLLAQALNGEVEVEAVHVQPARAAHELAEQTHALSILEHRAHGRLGS